MLRITVYNIYNIQNTCRLVRLSITSRLWVVKFWEESKVIKGSAWAERWGWWIYGGTYPLRNHFCRADGPSFLISLAETPLRWCSPCPLAFCSLASPHNLGLKAGVAAPSSGPCWWGLENPRADHCAVLSSRRGYLLWARAPTQAAPCRSHAVGTPSCQSLLRDAQHLHRAGVEASCSTPTTLQIEEEVGFFVTSPLWEPPSPRLKRAPRSSRDWCKDSSLFTSRDGLSYQSGLAHVHGGYAANSR